jgi:hypothetical protein
MKRNIYQYFMHDYMDGLQSTWCLSSSPCWPPDITCIGHLHEASESILSQDEDSHITGYMHSPSHSTRPVRRPTGPTSAAYATTRHC